MSKHQHLLDQLSSELKAFSNTLNCNPKELYMPMQYILDLGGKRMRPLLALIANDLFEGDTSKAIPSAIAIELFHNFSLIHDDIMDKAPLRRGKQTVHEKWNSNVAILSGDAMLVKAYEKLSESEPEHLPFLLPLFNKTALEVCEGQQFDMNYESDENVSIEQYLQMISLKTAVLLGCSMQMGAITSNATAEQQLHLYEFGKQFGISFQLKDDILDVFGESEKIGKQAGGDIILNKKTFLLLECLSIADASNKQELAFWLNKEEFNPTEKVAAVKSIYDALGIKELAEIEMQKHYDSAVNHLQLLDVNPSKKEALFELMHRLMNREQ